MNKAPVLKELMFYSMSGCGVERWTIKQQKNNYRVTSVMKKIKQNNGTGCLTVQLRKASPGVIFD